ncbi:MAG TPA: ABC transporter substrate-binding protein [Candidatus Angelobacter sp.]|nr:ABC transporter substrate-binding protein [Candidatus Angelobacter sp.]
MPYLLSLKIVTILVLTAAGGSLGGLAYYYQARAASLNSQVSNLNSNASSLNDQITALKAEIANLTAQISRLKATNSHLNQTYLQIQSLEAQLTAANTQLQSLETQLSNEITRVQALESSFNTQLTTLSAQLAQAQAEIAQLQNQISQLQTQLQQSSGLCLSGKTITIGELLDLTDGLSVQGIRAKDGSALAINDINSFLFSAGCRVRFAMSVSDYALDSSRALTEMQAFAAAGVQVVVGPLNSGAIQNILQFADANHIVLISPSSTSIALSIPNDYLFRTAPDDKWQGMADARMGQAEGASKLVIVQRHDSYGDALANATGSDFRYILGNTGTVDTLGCVASDTVCVIPYDVSLTDFTAVITTLHNAFQALNSTSPNRVAIDAVSFEEFSQLIYQINQQHPSLLNGRLPGTGAGPTSMWIGTDGEAQDTFISGFTTGPIVSSIRLPSTVYGFLNNTKTERLYTSFASTYPAEICDNYCTSAYDDIWLAALATLQVGSYNGTRIQAVMLTVADNYYGVTGWTQLEPSGDRVAAIYEIWKVVTPSGGTPMWVYAGYWDATTSTFVGFNPY